MTPRSRVGAACRAARECVRLAERAPHAVTAETVPGLLARYGCPAALVAAAVPLVAYGMSRERPARRSAPAGRTRATAPTARPERPLPPELEALRAEARALCAAGRLSGLWLLRFEAALCAASVRYACNVEERRP